MSTGFNSNVEARGAVYHVQTEDRGLQHPFVDTVVLSGGRVVYRRSVGYQDLLNGAAMDEAARAVLDGFPIPTDVKIVRYPDRYMDKRGAVMWQRVMRLLAQFESVERVA